MRRFEGYEPIGTKMLENSVSSLDMLIYFWFLRTRRDCV